MKNQISVFKANDLSVVCEVSGLTTLTGYTAELTVKKNIYSTDIVIATAGTIADFDISFNISDTDNDIAPGSYKYDIVINNATAGLTYTIVQDDYIVKDSVSL